MQEALEAQSCYLFNLKELLWYSVQIYELNRERGEKT